MQKRSKTEDNETPKTFHNTTNHLAILKVCNTGYKGDSLLAIVWSANTQQIQAIHQNTNFDILKLLKRGDPTLTHLG